MAAADYSINLTVSGSTYTIAAVKRAPGVVASGGTELKVTYGDVGSGLTGDVGTVLQRCIQMVKEDKADND